ncbi:hypothetical protein ABE322_25180 [Priestia megaterium]
MNKGISFGRPKAKVSQEFIEAYNRWKRKEFTTVKVMKEEAFSTKYIKFEKL